MAPPPKRLNLPTTPAQDGADEAKRPRSLNLPTMQSQAPASHSNGPRAMPLPTAPATSIPPVRAKSPTDLLLDRVTQIAPEMEAYIVRARIDRLLVAGVSDLLSWGENNLAPMRSAASDQARIASRLSQINAQGWIEETVRESCRIPGMLDRFRSRPPEYYEGMVRKARGELDVLIRDLEALERLITPDVHDLFRDFISLQVVTETYGDASMLQAANNRLRTLMGAHQTLQTLIQVIIQARDTCANHIAKIDDLLTVTIPNWTMAYKR